MFLYRHKFLIFLVLLPVAIAVFSLTTNTESAFRDKVEQESKGWLTRHFGTRFPEIATAHANLCVHQHSLRTKIEKLEQTQQELSDTNAQRIISDNIYALTQQEAKLTEICEKLEELTYTYILVHSAQQLLPKLADSEDMKALLSEINQELRVTEEIEKSINHPDSE